MVERKVSEFQEQTEQIFTVLLNSKQELSCK
jgi:hypothetical protein